MLRSRGNMSIHHLFQAEEIGASTEPNLDRLVKIFLQISEGILARWIEMPKGMLLLVMVPGNPASGAIYIYDRVQQQFSLISFEGADDNLTTQDFDGLLGEYNLVDCASNPALIRASSSRPATA